MLPELPKGRGSVGRASVRRACCRPLDRKAIKEAYDQGAGDTALWAGAIRRSGGLENGLVYNGILSVALIRVCDKQRAGELA